MPTHVKQNGVWTPVKELLARQSGSWLPVQRAFVKSAGVWVPVYEAVAVVTLSSTITNLSVKNLFSNSDWVNPYKKKRLIIPAGVVVGATSTAQAALLTGTDGQGLLEIIVNGEVQGAGGISGPGGPAINVGQSGVTIFVNGAVRGGGGRGGDGGQGGPGYWTQEYAEGPVYDGSSYRWFRSSFQGFNSCGVVWAGANPLNFSSTADATEGAGNDGWTYYRGAFRANGANGSSNWEVMRRRWEGRWTTGGAGGAGGRGQGYDGGIGAGANGAGGGTNAGSGGRGGNGGSWGAAGAPGAAGNSGNNGGGAGGNPGSAAGAAITGVARTVVNSGTINGTFN